jgi:C1A family cysteine protease
MAERKTPYRPLQFVPLRTARGSGIGPVAPAAGSPATTTTVPGCPGGPFGCFGDSRWPFRGVRSGGPPTGAWPGGPFGGAWPGGPFGAVWPGGPLGGACPGGPFGCFDAPPTALRGAWPGGPFGGAWPGGPFGAWAGGPFGGAWPGGPFGGAWAGGPFGGAWPASGDHGGHGCNCGGKASDPERDPLPVGLGWHAEMPDLRDLQLGCGDQIDQLRAMFPSDLPPERARYRPRHVLDNKEPPTSADVRLNLSPDPNPYPKRKMGRWSVEDQGELNSCTAHAVIGLVEYLVRWQLKQALDLSRLFLYGATRRLLGWTGDPGAYIRTTMKALAVFGAPPEQFWPYDVGHFDAEPDAFLYSYAASFKAMTYMRLDANQMSGPTPAPKAKGKMPAADDPPTAARDTLRLLKQTLADGYPVAFGFPIYSCVRTTSPFIPAPTIDDRLLGGHAVLAVGYDPAKFGGRGGIRFRNSWGDAWGTRGYGWLPYSYVTDGLACDFWTIFNQSWIDGRRFQ